MKISVILPCYNEEENVARIPEVLIPELAVLSCNYEIVLIDDGSRDKTLEAARGLNISQLKIIEHEKNRGVGAAFRTAFQNLNSDLAVVLDADFTFHPRYIKDLLSRYEKGDVDFVGGSPRLAKYGKEIKWWRTLISKIANIVYAVLFSRKVTAASQFFRLYRTADLKDLNLETSGFDISVEILFKLLSSGKRYAEIPAPLTARQFGESKLNYKKEMFRHFKLLFKIIGWKIKNLFADKKFRDGIFAAAFTLSAFLGSAIFILMRLAILFKIKSLGLDYNFFSFFQPDALSDSTAMLRDVFDGKLWVTDGKTYEYMNAPSLWSFVTPYFLAPLLWLLPLSLAFLAGHYIAGLGAFIIVYFLAKHLTENRIFSLFFSLVFVSATLLPSFVLPISRENLSIVARAVTYLGSFVGEPILSKYNSTNIYPALIFFALSFLFIYLSLVKKQKKYTALAGLCIGALIYMYITDAMYLLAGLGGMFAIYLLQKNFGQAKRIFWIVLTAFLTSSFYWFNFFAIRALPYSDELYKRLGGELTREFRWSAWPEYLGYGILGVIIWFWAKKKDKKDLAVYLIGWLLAIFISLNLQVITGFNPSPFVWYFHQFYFGLALVYLVLIYWVYDYLRKKSRFLKIFSSVILVVFAGSIIIRMAHTQIYMASYMYPYHIMPEKFSRSFDWIDKNIETDAVFVTPSLVSIGLLPSYTRAAVVTPTGYSFPGPIEEIFDRWLLAYKLFGVNPEYIRIAMRRKIGIIDNFSFQVENGLDTFMTGGFYFKNTLDSYKKKGDLRWSPMPEETLNKLVEGLKNYTDRPKELLTKYKVDYFYVGPYEKRITKKNFDKVSYLEKVYSQDGIDIYKIDKKKI